jgi:hypothetical protein
MRQTAILFCTVNGETEGQETEGQKGNAKKS